MSKVTFRPKILDSGRQMPIFIAEVLPDLGEYSAINRSVPQMPTGMEKEEESEHHLLKAICSGQLIPTPEAVRINDNEYSQLYPKTFRQPKQTIRLQMAFLLDSDEPEYNTDTEDEKWLLSQANKINIDERKFESIMDKLEKSSGQTVISLNEAKVLIKDDADIVIAIYDYWLNKRLKKQHPLIYTVKTDSRLGSSANNPYIAFRKRLEKMQTRKNRKNDEISYERMLKFKRDVVKALHIIELIRRRERIKKEKLNVNSKIFEKRYEIKDFTGNALQETINLCQRTTSTTTTALPRSVFSTLYHSNDTNWSDRTFKDDPMLLMNNIGGSVNRRVALTDKRQYKRRKHKTSLSKFTDLDSVFTSDEDESGLNATLSESEEDDNPFVFKRNKHSSYHMPKNLHNATVDDKNLQYSLTSLSHPNQCIGFARRRIGRGGRIIIDRSATSVDDLLQLFDNQVIERDGQLSSNNNDKTEVTVPQSNHLPFSIPSISITPPDDQVASCSSNGPIPSDFQTFNTKNVSFNFDEIENWPHFRPLTPPVVLKSESNANIATNTEEDLEITVQIQNCNRNDNDPLFTTQAMNLDQDFKSILIDPSIVPDSWSPSTSISICLQRLPNSTQKNAKIDHNFIKSF